MAGEINFTNPSTKAEGLYNVYSIRSNSANELFLKDNIFQTTLEKAVESLNRISQMEIKADLLIDDYLQGKASLEEVIIAMEKATVAVNLAMTVINSAVQTTKEILQMAV
jgi:flagellar hook-basal body complex protein FliE